MKTKRSVPEISISGLGLVTPVGHDVLTACASIRAGLSRPRKLPTFYASNEQGYEFYDDGLITGHPVLGPTPSKLEDRIMALLSMALTDLKRQSGLDESLFFKAQVFLALPGQDRGHFDEPSFQKRLRNFKAWPFDRDNPVQFYSKGHAGMLFAMTDAVEALQRGEIDRAVVAGSDSLVNVRDLTDFHLNERLKTSLNPNGLIPGEAAAALLIEKTVSVQKRKGRAQSMVKVISTTYEAQDAPGLGLSDAIVGLIPFDGKPLFVDAVICDLNGEPGRFDEWAMVKSKVFHKIKGAKRLVCPAKNTGDTGAASAGLSICVASCGMERGYLSLHSKKAVSHALVLSSSDTGERAALLLESA